MCLEVTQEPCEPLSPSLPWPTRPVWVLPLPPGDFDLKQQILWCHPIVDSVKHLSDFLISAEVSGPLAASATC